MSGRTVFGKLYTETAIGRTAQETEQPVLPPSLSGERRLIRTAGNAIDLDPLFRPYARIRGKTLTLDVFLSARRFKPQAPSGHNLRLARIREKVLSLSALIQHEV